MEDLLMLKEIQLVNFEPHEDTELKFDSGLNVICGSSDSGKSSLIRAMKWVGLNSMRGDGFIRNGESRAEVTVVSGDHSVTRVRSSSVNSYSVDDGIPLKGFGSNLPEGVEQALKLGDINFQSQLEPHFLMSATGGETGKFLNRIVSLDEIDGVLTTVESERRRNVRMIEEGEGEIADLREELLTYQDLDAAAESYGKLVELSGELSEAEEYVGKLTPLRDRLAGLDPRMARLSNAGEAAKEADSLGEAAKQWKAAVQREKALIDLAGSLDRVREGIQSIQGVPEAAAALTGIQSLYDGMSRKWDRVETLEKLSRQLKSKAKDISRAETERKSAETRLHNQIQELPEQCPYCGATIDKENLV
jgi:DNA repair protein SbcC/Rad50